MPRWFAIACLDQTRRRQRVVLAAAACAALPDIDFFG